jgi:hypothetical protein
LAKIRKIIEEHERGFIHAWKEHFRY